MRKKVFGRQLSRSRRAREALFKSLIKELILRGKIVTTFAKAKAIQADVDKIVVIVKKEGVAALRQISATLSADREQVARLVKNASTFTQRTSGFTRIVRLTPRKGDAASMARLEWTELVVDKAQVTSNKKEKSKEKTKNQRKQLVKKTAVRKAKKVTKAK